MELLEVWTCQMAENLKKKMTLLVSESGEMEQLNGTAKGKGYYS